MILSRAPRTIPQWELKVSPRDDPERRRSGFPLAAQGRQHRIDLRLHQKPGAPERGRASP